MMRRQIVGAAVAVAAIASPAAAKADFGGLYIGSHIGGNFPSIEAQGDFDNGAATLYELEPDGWTAGVHIGYNLPLQGAIVGIEGAWSAANDADTRPATSGGGTADDFASFVFNDTLTLAARFGFVIAPRYMPFVKVGVAWADIEGQAGDTDAPPPAAR